MFLSDHVVNIHYLRGVTFRLQETKRLCLNALMARLDRADSDVTFDSPQPHCNDTHYQLHDDLERYSQVLHQPKRYPSTHNSSHDDTLGFPNAS